MKPQSIIWAIDPYQNNPRIWQRAKELANYASRSFKFPLQPVYIADRGSLPPFNAFDPATVKKFILKSELRLNRMLKPLHLKKLSSPQVLFSEELNTKAEAQLLNKLAKRNGAPFVIATTNARKGMERFLQGSFAETLVGTSQTPVVLSNPLCRPLKKIDHIVFATDFSRLSQKALRKLCDTAVKGGAKIEIVSVLSAPFIWAEPATAFLPVAAAQAGEELLKLERKAALRSGTRLVKVARELGVEATFSLVETPLASVSSTLLKSVTKKKADMVALAARGDTARALFFGSTAQEVIRNSRVPVWLYHAQIRAK